MSDVSQGSGWWIAVDGKWYPPEQHPSALATATLATPPVLPDEKREGNTSQSSGWRNASDGGARDQSPLGAVPRAATMQGDLLTSVPVTSHSLTDFSSRALPTSATSQRRRTPLKRRSLLLAVMALIVLVGGGVLVYSLTHDSGTSITGDSPRQVIALATARGPESWLRTRRGEPPGTRPNSHVCQ